MRAAAPALVRALLAAEVMTRPCSEGCGNQQQCGCCNGDIDYPDVKSPFRGHKDNCMIDAALKLAGLPDKASRDAARKEIAK